MTEADLQNLVVAHARVPTDLAIVPNVTCYGHESDILRLTKTRRVYEYEIKRTRADFRRDRKKWSKGLLLEDIRDGGVPDWRRHRTPNQFWYAVLDGVATVEDLPPRVGLLVIDPVAATVTVARQATSLHNEPAPDRIVAYLSRGMTLRYWQEREGVNPMRDARDELKRRMKEHREREKRDRAERRAYAARAHAEAVAMLAAQEDA